MTRTRAKAGGEQGINGEWYEGGEFLPSSPNTIKGEFKANKSAQSATPRKQEIAPYKWEISDRQAIWPQVSGICKFHKTGYSKETGSQGWLEVTIEPNGYWSEEAVSQIEKLAALWNNGERWI